MSNIPDLDVRLKELEAEFNQRRQQLVESSVGPLRDELNKVEHEIARLRSKADGLRAQLAKLTGARTAAAKPSSGRRPRRASMSLDEKRSKIAEILVAERVTSGYPVKGIAKRFASEANLTPADLTSENLIKFLPPGYSVAGSGRQKTFVKN